MKTFDAILVLGRGIDKDGQIPASAKATIKKAVELFNQKKTKHIVFSGKWSYRSKTDFLITEAEAMADFAKELGLPSEAIILEKDSDSTVTNVYHIKKQILQPKGWFNIALVSVEIFYQRAFLILKKILGTEYNCELILADFSFSEDKKQESQPLEEQKLEGTKKWFNSFTDGDHEAIYQSERKFIGKT